MGKQLFHIILGGIAVMVMIVPARTVTHPTIVCHPLTVDGPSFPTFVSTEPTANDVFMTLYTKIPHEKKAFRLSESIDLLLKFSKFNPRLPIIIFNSGFRTTPCDEATVAITTALMKRGEANVFVFDSAEYLNGHYGRAIKNSVILGELEGEWLADYYQADGVNKTIHLIGHSLGSHTAGSAGATFTALLPGHYLDRITALDPAGVLYELIPIFKLSKEDAKFVDVIHTDGLVLGIIQTIGHADFYPNLGMFQPGAWIIPEGHSRSWKYYVESIEDRFSFPTTCPWWTIFFVFINCNFHPRVYMGHDLSHSTRGIFYLATASTPPYGFGNNSINAFQLLYRRSII